MLLVFGDIDIGEKPLRRKRNEGIGNITAMGMVVMAALIMMW